MRGGATLADLAPTLARPRPPRAVAARRRLLDRLLWTAAGAAALAACGLLVGIVAVILSRGLPALDLGFLGGAEAGFGTAGGVLWQTVGTGILVATALAVAAPLAVAAALVHSVYLLRPAARRRVALALYVLNGVPSVLFGIFGLVVFVQGLGWGKSWLTGGLILGLMILPTLTVALVERMEALPARYRVAAAGLGLDRSTIARAVVLPQSWGGLVSGSLLGLARAAGETAPILFTAAVFSGATLPSGVRESPILALPYHVFVLAQDSFDPAVGGHLWGAAFVLLALVLGLALVALPFRLHMAEEARHG